MHIITKKPLQLIPKRYFTHQETGFSLYYVYKQKKCQKIHDFLKIEGRERRIFYVGDKLYLESDLRHPKFDTFRMSPAQIQWQEELTNPRLGEHAISEKHFFFKYFIFIYFPVALFMFYIWNELQKLDFLHSEQRRGRTFSWYVERLTDDLSYAINVRMLGKDKEDYETEFMKMKTPGRFFGRGDDSSFSTGSCLLVYHFQCINHDGIIITYHRFCIN